MISKDSLYTDRVVSEIHEAGLLGCVWENVLVISLPRLHATSQAGLKRLWTAASIPFPCLSFLPSQAFGPPQESSAVAFLGTVSSLLAGPARDTSGKGQQHHAELAVSSLRVGKVVFGRLGQRSDDGCSQTFRFAHGDYDWYRFEPRRGKSVMAIADFALVRQFGQ